MSQPGLFVQALLRLLLAPPPVPRSTLPTLTLEIISVYEGFRGQHILKAIFHP